MAESATGLQELAGSSGVTGTGADAGAGTGTDTGTDTDTDAGTDTDAEQRRGRRAPGLGCDRARANSYADFFNFPPTIVIGIRSAVKIM
jgi:hypothetical protein